MRDNLMNFKGYNVEVFEWNGMVLFNPKHVAKILDIKNVNDNLRKMNKNQVIKLKNSDIGNADIRKLNNAGENFLSESGVYKLVFKSKKPEAERFSDWVTDEVLPTIRKTGGYVNNDNLFINTYLPFADDNTKLLFSQTLNIIKQQNNLIEKQKEEINHKQQVINGLTDDIDVYTKRIIINRICKKANCNYGSRYKELYKCYKETYHIDLELRCKRYNAKQLRKKDELSVIAYAEENNLINDLYSCCVKLYETEVKEIIERLQLVKVC